jgi:hypothetical protein
VRTLGIDLSAQPKKTAACSIAWGDTVEVEELVVGCDDDALLDRMGDAAWIGIDAPFGWPVEFVETVGAWAAGQAWPTSFTTQQLSFRETDRAVLATRRPLSVSTDRIGICAMRCARVLTALAERRGTAAIDRTGADQVVEVYPGAALPVWSGEAADLRLDPGGYKGTKPEQAAKREELVEALERGASWLRLEPAHRALCLKNDDALDAVLCALIARAAQRGLTVPPEGELQSARAPVEGWIHLPRAGTLASLAEA